MEAATEEPGARTVEVPGLANRQGTTGLSAFVAALERNTFLLVVLGVATAAYAWFVRDAIASDTWYTLLGGQRILASGLPHRDTLTVLTLGREWVDQQWLAQVFVYSLWRAGGWPLALLTAVALFVGAFAVLGGCARRLGASDRSVALSVLLCYSAGLPNTVLRAQIPAYLLFALVLALLLLDERSPSPRTYLVFPLLVVWANIHGSVVVGAGLVCLRGAILALPALRQRLPARTWVPRSAAFLVLPWLCILASPYGLALPGYYRRVLDNPTLARVATEWGPTTVRSQPLDFVLLFVGLWLIGRSPRTLTPYAQLVWLGSAVGGLLATRNVVWFALASAAILPLAIDAAWLPARGVRRRRLNLSLVAAGVAAAVTAVVVIAVHGRAWFERSYPRAAESAVAAAARADPRLRVFADEAYADWLLFEDPQLAGRVAYDVRFEMLSSQQLWSLADFRGETGIDWMKPTAGYGLLVLSPTGDAGAVRVVERSRGSRVLFADSQVVVLRRGSAAAGG